MKSVFLQEVREQLRQATKLRLQVKKCPPQVKDMENFERDLIEMIQNIKFRKTKDSLQKKLKEDIRSARNSDKAFTPDDKTTNMYEKDKNMQDKIPHENITKLYKKYNEISREAKQIARKLGTQDRGTTLAWKQAFITLRPVLNVELLCAKPNTRYKVHGKFDVCNN